VVKAIGQISLHHYMILHIIVNDLNSLNFGMNVTDGDFHDVEFCGTEEAGVGFLCICPAVESLAVMWNEKQIR